MLNKLEKRAYTLIIEAHNVNFAIPKGYGTNSLAYILPYRKKSLLIEGAINLIKKYNLNITWGYRDGVTYFDVPRISRRLRVCCVLHIIMSLRLFILIMNK